MIDNVTGMASHKSSNEIRYPDYSSSVFDDLRKLKQNWDSYGALPINPASIALAERVVEMLKKPPHIVPTSGGGVQLEWGLDGCFQIEVVGEKLEVYLLGEGACR